MAWYMSDDFPTNNLFSDVPENCVESPYPKALWRIDVAYNNGFPYHELLGGEIPYNPPAPIYAIKPQKQIQVYEYTTSQENLLSKNGVAILFPESCTSRHELNGRWDITLTHKIDKLGKWEYLKFENILKIGGQLFRIDNQQTQIDYDKELITVHANHIFYDLNCRIVQREPNDRDVAIFVADSETIAAHTYWDLLASAPYPVNAIDYWENEIDLSDKYTHIPVVWGADDSNAYVFEKILDDSYYWEHQPSMDCHGKTVVDLIIGSDGFINRWGGELYRDNFHFSICPTMENSEDNSFYLRFPIELKNQVYSIDTNDLTTVLSCIDVNGDYAGGNTGSYPGLHHHRPMVYQLSVPYSQSVKDIIWNKYNRLQDSTEVEINELKYNPQFKDKEVAVPRYNVGDKGYIVIKGNAEKYKIIATEKDEITKDFISITFKKID